MSAKLTQECEKAPKSVNDARFFARVCDSPTLGRYRTMSNDTENIIHETAYRYMILTLRR